MLAYYWYWYENHILIKSSSSSSANCNAVGHELSPFLPVLCLPGFASPLAMVGMPCLADYAGNVLMEYQLWMTGFTFAMSWVLLTNSFSVFRGCVLRSGAVTVVSAR